MRRSTCPCRQLHRPGAGGPSPATCRPGDDRRGRGHHGSPAVGDAPRAGGRGRLRYRRKGYGSRAARQRFGSCDALAGWRTRAHCPGPIAHFATPEPRSTPTPSRVLARHLDHQIETSQQRPDRIAGGHHVVPAVQQRRKQLKARVPANGFGSMATHTSGSLSAGHVVDEGPCTDSEEGRSSYPPAIGRHGRLAVVTGGAAPDPEVELETRRFVAQALAGHRGRRVAAAVDRA